MNLDELRVRLGSAPPAARSFTDVYDSMPIERCVPGRVVEGRLGEYFVLDSVRGRDQSHGLHRFGNLGELASSQLGMLAGLGEEVALDLETTAFIDTETTGLGYGVGTHVFMVGVGHREGDAFRVRQFFLRHPGEEPSMLAALSDHLANFRTVVSFNGRSFDWPLLENRFVYRRIPLQPADPFHIDLLHLSRRLWKLRLPSCGLDSIEQHILGVRRTRDDISGWMIPQLYFQYMRSGNARPLQRVFYHNLHDILTLAILFVHVQRLLEDPWGGLVNQAVDFFSLGRMYEKVDDMEQAIRCFQTALDKGLPYHLDGEALLRMALIEKRRRNWEAAAVFFNRVIESRGFERIASVELAKYYEHVARDHERAMKFTTRAMKSLDQPDYLRWPGTRRPELHHRRQRLLRRTTLGPAKAI